MEFKVLEHKYLPPNTILVSSDIARLMRERYGEEGRDAAFLRTIGIDPTPEASPDAGPQQG